MLRSCLAFALLTTVALTGCNDSYDPADGVVVTGVIVQDGKPLEVPNRQAGLGNVEVLLVPIAAGEGAETFSDFAKEDGAFTIAGPGDGIKPGKYRLAVHQQDQGYGSDMLKGAFGTTTSPIEVEIPAEKVGKTHDLGTIDLATAGKK